MLRSLVALLKGVFAKLAGTLVVQGVAGGVAQPTSAASGTFVDGSIATIGTQADFGLCVLVLDRWWRC